VLVLKPEGFITRRSVHRVEGLLSRTQKELNNS
jgi:hypothetical protein